MGMISKIVQKIEGYDWEEGRNFDVQGITELAEGSFAVQIKQLNEKDRNPVETLVNRLRSYSTDKEIYALQNVSQNDVPYIWDVKIVIDKNEGYVPTEGAKE